VIGRLAGGFAVSLVLGAAAAGATGGSPRMSEQLLPLPPIGARPVPAPLPPPTNLGVAPAPPAGISPLLLQPDPGPVYTLPQPGRPASPPLSLSAPIDQQKMGSYRNWLLGQQRLLERNGDAEDYLGREIQRQLLQLEQSGGVR
jgi:hypothetical protein